MYCHRLPTDSACAKDLTNFLLYPVKDLVFNRSVLRQVLSEHDFRLPLSHLIYYDDHMNYSNTTLSFIFYCALIKVVCMSVGKRKDWVTGEKPKVINDLD